MIQLTAPSEDSESGSTPLSPEYAFISVMGKDRSGRIRCRGSRETLRTWYGSGEGSSSSAYRQHIASLEDQIRAQGEEMEQLRTQVHEMHTQQSEMCTQQSEVEEMRRQLTQLQQIMTQF